MAAVPVLPAPALPIPLSFNPEINGRRSHSSARGSVSNTHGHHHDSRRDRTKSPRVSCSSTGSQLHELELAAQRLSQDIARNSREHIRDPISHHQHYPHHGGSNQRHAHARKENRDSSGHYHDCHYAGGSSHIHSHSSKENAVEHHGSNLKYNINQAPSKGAGLNPRRWF
ncbi:hypothetical protein B0I35DRAFT_81584 [Stachybotrys elegans]|uniref:Uncharacterized protein n=1 Tax=Stachybotrys elegans TaxID=80388 RepID=A0A8K0SIW9_9HYPO|nr:hypothetical protein B0I35DRAFT_81584 [Stachybotrys elegans]